MSCNKESHQDTEFNDIFCKELETISNRRKKMHLKSLDKLVSSECQTKPSTKYGLVGLALSGGGIRSATFNLGVIQGLAKRGILKYVDYLSTVSGGGYIGSCLSALLNNPKHTPEWVKGRKKSFPFFHRQGKQESESFKHLRNYSNYLAPNGLIDKLRIPATVLRGILINLLIIFPYVVFATFISQYIFESKIPVVWEEYKDQIVWVVGIVLGLFGLLTILVPLFMKLCPRIKWPKRNFLGRFFGRFLLLIIVVLAVCCIPYVITLWHYNKWNVWKELWLIIAAIIQFIPALFAGKASESISRLGGKIALYALGLIGPLTVFIIYLYLYSYLYLNENPEYVSHTYIGAVLVFLYTHIFVDVNITSPHGFYRDRLSKAYLFDVANSGIAHADTLKLSELNKNTKAPYHLINVAHNLHDSEDRSLRGRNADFFILSKHFCGSDRVEYIETEQMEKVDPHLNLGTAMAISGAAAAPNMGTTTIGPLVFIMALLNIRLGYWLPNPQKLQKTLRNKISFNINFNRWSPLSGVGPLYLLYELFGYINAKRRYINISDGGHLENMGAYELLRRRCRYIIIGDGEADSDHSFYGLATFIRYAQIDMGIKIDIDLDDLKKDKRGLSHKHYVCGTIHYTNREKGYLLYIKSSMTGDENVYIHEYHNNNPEFPHESTGDQFFDEAQFEAYRALGYHVCSQMGDVQNGQDLDQFFSSLIDTQDACEPAPGA